MSSNDDALKGRAAQVASAFGTLIRYRRKALNMRQDQLALATGVGRRFVIDLEGGKPSCQLGRSLLVAEALGIWSARPQPQSAASPELPDLAEGAEEPNGQSTGVF